MFRSHAPSSEEWARWEADFRKDQFHAPHCCEGGNDVEELEQLVERTDSSKQLLWHAWTVRCPKIAKHLGYLICQALISTLLRGETKPSQVASRSSFDISWSVQFLLPKSSNPTLAFLMATVIDPIGFYVVLILWSTIMIPVSYFLWGRTGRSATILRTGLGIIIISTCKLILVVGFNVAFIANSVHNIAAVWSVSEKAYEQYGQWAMLVVRIKMILSELTHLAIILNATYSYFLVTLGLSSFYSDVIQTLVLCEDDWFHYYQRKTNRKDEKAQDVGKNDTVPSHEDGQSAGIGNDDTAPGHGDKKPQKPRKNVGTPALNRLRRKKQRKVLGNDGTV